MKHFFRVYIASSKHEEGWENSRQLCKPETYSRVCITLENFPSPPSAKMRLCKRGKSALLLLQFLKIRANLKRHNRVYILSSHLSTNESARSGSVIWENPIVYAMVFTVCFIIQLWHIIGARVTFIELQHIATYVSSAYTHGQIVDDELINRSARFINLVSLGNLYIIYRFRPA